MNTASSVLIIEDDNNLRRLYTKALAHNGYLVTEAAAVESARNLLNSHQYHLVICDMQLGAERSIHMLREFRDLLETTGTKLVIATGQSQYQYDSNDLNVALFLHKPIAISSFINLITRIVPPFQNTDV